MPRALLQALLALVLLLVLLALSACAPSSDNGARLQSATVPPGSVASPSIQPDDSGAGTDAPEDDLAGGADGQGTTTDDTGSAEAEEFKRLGPALVGVDDQVVDFIAGLAPVRVDQLAGETCAAVSPAMGDAELGVAGISAYEQLSGVEQGAIALDNWVVFYGAVIGYFCPENLPDIDLEAIPIEGGLDDQFRALVAEVSELSAEAERFVTQLSDQRLPELATAACAAAGPDMTDAEFGGIIVASYGQDLTEQEIAGVGLPAYSEVYGALVGWFCPQNLPS